MKNIYINTCITMNFCILFVIFHKLSKYGKFYYILIEQQWKCSCSNKVVYTNTVLIQNIYTHTFSRSRYMYGIYSEESRQKSERENLAHLGTIRISFKDSWHVPLSLTTEESYQRCPLASCHFSIWKTPYYHTHLIQTAIN